MNNGPRHRPQVDRGAAGVGVSVGRWRGLQVEVFRGLPDADQGGVGATPTNPSVRLGPRR
ncbi:hypothetical protein I553_3714 [Mycobacterium xenopi 4042]|uniref:Uncharacterized protein n=1 Tax=Mycobacterium xenopi 4042 TaxID=1299334 RepID=X7YTB0_MYCXE|nr:hypothetical protein I553_3714 [Mycobacterium xenopi 4042]